MKLLLPQGIGDSLWALTKVQAVTQGQPAEVSLNCSQLNYIQARALKFVERFDFVSNVSMALIDILKEQPISPEGYYNYIDDGPLDPFDYVLMPNGPLERGQRLDTWLPQFKTDWNVGTHFRFKPDEKQFGRDVAWGLGDYCVFYIGPEGGNTKDGHNRGPLWTPDDWGALADGIAKMGLNIVVVGADYDQAYFREFILPQTPKHRGLLQCRDFIGQWEIGMTFAVVKGARFIVAYQSGIGIFASYLGVPTTIFWRPKGDSISPHHYLSFEESMASAWTPPHMIRTQRHMPCIYGKHTPEYILDEIAARGW